MPIVLDERQWCRVESEHMEVGRVVELLQTRSATDAIAMEIEHSQR